ncbi:hypothetical protein [uncultured Winogradskyella sp.]|uniref:hypothetical protein n=1 Tax=uncultured Winogradskyella sp. TaxID=395353 RepID=UPI002612C69E|nr:hypothetical protein [uncultured Winogradskyella sp.]
MNFRKIVAFSMLGLLLMNFQCNEDDLVTSNCDDLVVVDNSTYQTVESAFYSLISADISDDCLLVNISSSGCDGSTWILTLVDSEDIAESLPPQRYLKLSLVNNEACLAVFNKEQSFDLTPLRIEGANEILLNIEDFPESLTYSY